MPRTFVNRTVKLKVEIFGLDSSRKRVRTSPDLIPTSLLFSHVFTISASKVRTAWIPKLEVSHLGRPAEVSGPSFAMKVEFPRGISARMVKLFVKMMKTSGQHLVLSESPVETLEVWQSIDFKPGQALERHKSHFSPRVSNKPGLDCTRFTKDSYVVKSRLVMV